MKLKLLGTGGVAPIPRPTCFCKICSEARDKGIPFARTGPAIYIYGADLLFDMPEEIKEQLNRERINSVKRIILTHWHPDHTNGVRAIEMINWNFAEKKPYHTPIEVYISKHQYDLLKKYSCGGFLDYYVARGSIQLKFFEAGDKVIFNQIQVEAVLISKTKGFYYIIRDLKSKAAVVYAPCEYHELIVSKETRDIDLFIVHNLFWEDPTVSPRKNAPEDEDTFEQMLGHATEMSAKRIIITHIEETFQLSHDDLNKLFKSKYASYNLEAGYDGQIFEI